METCIIYCFYSVLILLSISSGVSVTAEEAVDVMSGLGVTLHCRFHPSLTQKTSTLYWIRSNRHNHDNVAIGLTAFHQEYSVEQSTVEGRYDLHISHADYDRDNGKFECRIKEDGTGVELYTVTISLTVLLAPLPPTIIAPSSPAVEGQSYTLSCSSRGGSPAPSIHWVRLQDGHQMVANVSFASDRDGETVSVLEFVPRKEDDGSEYRCEVNSRAIKHMERLTTTVNISVNYFPVVTIGPENPYRVELDQTAEMLCCVDSKPRTDSVKWEFSGRFIDTNFRHVIPQVSMQDAGSYYCSGDNGLGDTDKEELILDVQYGPHIIVSGANDVDLGETISLNCQVSSNPRPLGVTWLKKDNPEFEQKGQTLEVSQARAEDSGEYVCSSYNFLHPTGRGRLKREKNATVMVNVRHKPGQASILPEEAIGVVGRSVTLVCSASPPGYPEPSYRWWREGEDSSMVSVSSHYTIPSVEAFSEGRYYCQPHNSLGYVLPASVELQVQDTPKLSSSPPPTLTKQSGDSNLLLSCSASAKPKPNVRWFKDGVELLTSSQSRFKIFSNEQGQNVLSTLNFVGDTRSNTNKLDYQDKGRYTCQFENQVGRSEHTTLLVVEHSPIQEHPHNKVAYDIGEPGQIYCKMRAYPEPRFDWTFGDDVLELDVVNYSSNVTRLDEDLFESVLTVTKVRETSYGEYTCRALNSMGALRTKILLQRKGPPEVPTLLVVKKAGVSMATLNWRRGFDGGYKDTVFVVEYTKYGDTHSETQTCSSLSTCNMTSLHQHTKYKMRVRATNSAGKSPWSESVCVHTQLDLLNIPTAESAVFELSTNLAHVRTPNSEIPLVAQLEVMDSVTGDWTKCGETQLEDGETYGQMTVAQAYSQLHIVEEGAMTENVKQPVRIRVRLCLENSSACGPYLEGKTVTHLEVRQPWMIALVVVITLLGLVIILIAIKCVCSSQRKTPSKPGHSTNMLTHPSTFPHSPIARYKSVQVFTIAANNQHDAGTLQSSYDPKQHIQHRSSNSQTDSSNSQEPLWTYQKSPEDCTNMGDTHFTNTTLQGYESSPGSHYPYIDETPTSAHSNYFTYTTSEETFSRPMSGQYNCNTGMGESQYSYQDLPDPSSYFIPHKQNPSDGICPNMFIQDSSLIEGLQTPNTRARRVVHEVIV